MPPNQTHLQDQIDLLLQRHLILLDQYTHLRAHLSRLQSSTFQDLARANFSAPRGQRFGQEQYDERMRASRRMRLRGGEPVKFCVVRTDNDGGYEGERGAGDGNGRDDTKREEDTQRQNKMGEDGKGERDGNGAENGNGREDANEETNTEEGEDDDDDDDEKGTTEDANDAENGGDKIPRSRNPPNDPLRWFGLLTPTPLRAAQGHAIQAVEEVIPRLASVMAEMQHVEIEVRRARKRRAKTEAKAEAEAKTAEES
ncbi:hypothetical protein E4U17_000866 [Claviceps sp. LM77 group G4]|nr:hypothetical protein E4U17_000866 [Claviceps sp. LM77 group G4]KAG6078281.1 hypothetical protein E4U33_000773 [Claviceps sp. LM78 group G4]